MSCPIMTNVDVSECTPVPALSDECYPTGGGDAVVYFYGDPIVYGQSTQLLYTKG